MSALCICAVPDAPTVAQCRAVGVSEAAIATKARICFKCKLPVNKVEPAPDTAGDVLTQLRIQGAARCARWHTPDAEPWTGADWGNAMGGEAGEAQNVVKKIRRIETGTGSANDGLTMAELLAMLANELADTIAYADLLAQHYGIDLRKAIADKFNDVSKREGFPERIRL